MAPSRPSVSPGGEALASFAYTTADLDVLSRWLTEPDANIRALAARGLARLGPAAKPALPKLMTALKDSDKGIRLAALSAVGAIGREAHTAVPLLRRCLRDSDVDVRRGAIEAVGQMDGVAKEAVPAVAEAARQKDLRKPALDVIVRLGPTASEAIPVLAELLSSDKENRPAIMAAIKAIHPQKKQATLVAAALIKLFGLQDASGRYDASQSAEVSSALASMGKQAVPALIDGLANANGYVRWKVAETLGQIGRPARPAARALAIHAETDAYRQVRDACQAALERVR